MGRGPRSTVYKGILKNKIIETIVAVKNLHKMAIEDDQEFKAKGPTGTKECRLHLQQLERRGICYLHEQCNSKIIHRHIKPQNVLLDESFTGKISDFWIRKLLKPDKSKTTTRIKDTKGYVTSEWFRNMLINIKVDVYNFGVLLLELICRGNYEPNIG
ncbi:G-type lectin S-receptor-like serine threonine-kinase LECRK2 [Olea europaea subsp. europaea]|uniref:G-type lectin S-receptor-like serine threonine-kinase LECRK2 n=1 Tax=Olea europaea subsp. europaea TaxID=158383 RepID=A0A8S0SMW4_OLEEU|nr:G-type lectin S-receptor-like serine threonine-kinase LECRK2 [Olea europaea subsp. europaea]